MKQIIPRVQDKAGEILSKIKASSLRESRKDGRYRNFLNWIKTPTGDKLHRYVDTEGEFDYEHYREVQVEGNKRKINNQFETEENIAKLSEFLKQELTECANGICHGTRRGNEQAWFRKHLAADVFGTEISDTATEFPHTIEWDFHKVKPEWLGKFDFVYSNSWDHSYDPEYCLNQWISCLKPGGLCILNHTTGHEPTSSGELDPFGVTRQRFKSLLARWGRGSYKLRAVLEGIPPKADKRWEYFVLQKIS